MSKKILFYRILSGLSIVLTLSIVIVEPMQIIAQSQNLANNNTDKENNLPPVEDSGAPKDNRVGAGSHIFNPPPVEDNGAPAGIREGAGSHGLCKIAEREKDISPLIALMPEVTIKTSTKNKIYVWGETNSAHPTFWFYAAYPVNSQVEFILQDEAENEVYQTTFSLDKNLGIISLTLPTDKVSLETGKSYHWYLYIMCNAENLPDDFVEGWIKRVELNSGFNNQLKLAQPLEQISIYAENGLWYDTLTHLDRLRQTEPENQVFSTIWRDLLQQVGLEEISQEPIVKRYNWEN